MDTQQKINEAKKELQKLRFREYIEAFLTGNAKNITSCKIGNEEVFLNCFDVIDAVIGLDETNIIIRETMDLIMQGKTPTIRNLQSLDEGLQDRILGLYKEVDNKPDEEEPEKMQDE